MSVWHQVILATIIGLALVSCEEAVFQSEELAAKKKFSTVSVGAASTDVIARLGDPLGIIEVKQNEKAIYQLRTSQTNQKSIELDFSASSRDSWPIEIRLLPRVLPTKLGFVRVLVYSEGTVHAYYFQGGDGRIKVVDIVIS